MPSTKFLVFVSFASFLTSIVLSAAVPGSAWGEHLSLVFHLAAFPIVPRLPAPDWTKAAGYL